MHAAKAYKSVSTVTHWFDVDPDANMSSDHENIKSAGQKESTERVNALQNGINACIRGVADEAEGKPFEIVAISANPLVVQGAQGYRMSYSITMLAAVGSSLSEVADLLS